MNEYEERPPWATLLALVIGLAALLAFLVYRIQSPQWEMVATLGWIVVTYGLIGRWLYTHRDAVQADYDKEQATRQAVEAAWERSRHRAPRPLTPTAVQEHYRAVVNGTTSD